MRKILKFLFFLMILITVVAIYFVFLIIKNNPTPCGHESISVQTVLPTCTKEGHTLHFCNSCDYSYVTDVTPKQAHSYTQSILAPTCYSEGYTLNFCSCGDLFKSDILPKLEHSFTKSETPSTCSVLGYTKYSCSVCDYFYTESYTEFADHIYSSTVSFPTALENGYTEYSCECSASYRDNILPYSEIMSSPYVESSEILSKGIDVSRWNHQIDPISGDYLPLDWNKIKASGFDFVIIKAGSTRSGKEPTFESDYEGAKKAGLKIGAYFYTYSSTVEGIETDVGSLIKYIEGKEFEYPIYFDIEDPSLTALGKDRLTELCETFICLMQKNGYYSGLYTNNNWLRNILNTSKILSLFDIWYARYPETDIPVWNEEKYGKQLSMWQYTQTGEIFGIEGYFDMNFCYRDYPEIMKKWGLNRVEKT